MKCDVRYAMGEIEFVLSPENPTEVALIDAIRDKEPLLRWTNQTKFPGNPSWARFAMEIRSKPAKKEIA